MPGDSKTEKATPKKREDERKKGNVFLSKDAVSIASLLLVFFTLKSLFPYMYETTCNFIYRYIGYIGTATDISETFANEITMDFMIAYMKISLPTMIAAIGVSVAATFAQTRFSFTKDVLKPKFNRLNPLEGIKKLFALKSIIEVVKGLIKIVIISVVIYNFISSQLVSLSKLLTMSLYESALYIISSVMDLVINVSMIFILLAGLDYLYQWWDYERQLKMSKQEVKEEYKQLEGDPQVKGKIKEIQRKMAMTRMMQSVPSADVVVRNPTHFAVALRYDIGRDSAPIVVAKGKDEIALRIVKVAEENDVYVVENVALARAIYASSEINSEIPLEHYGTVAEILAFVFKLKNKNI